MKAEKRKLMRDKGIFPIKASRSGTSFILPIKWKEIMGGNTL